MYTLRSNHEQLNAKAGLRIRRFSAYSYLPLVFL
jgi:hypothetical protein